jgi:hypothetical protein
VLEAARDKIARWMTRLRDLPAMAGAWILEQLIGPYPEPKRPSPETKTGEVVPFPTERDLVKPERRDPPP